MKFAAQITYLREILAFIHAAAVRAGFEPSKCHKIELACEEALVNIIQHAYEGQEQGGVEVQCYSPKRRELHITIKDGGHPFNPLSHNPEVDLSASVDERRVGGLGLYFIHKLMSEVHYQREAGQNVLSLVMKES